MPFEITVFAKALHQRRCGEAIADGIRTIGGVARLQEGGSAKTRLTACWGWRHGKALQSAGHDVLVMERGYLGDRFSNYSLAWNGLNGRGVRPRVADPARFDKQFRLGPWRTGEYILIAGQVPGDMSLAGLDLRPWYRTAASQAKFWGLPVVFRRHPEVEKRGYQVAPAGAALSRRSLAEDLAGAHLCVTWNSNTAVDAVIAGVPAVTMDEGSMAWPVTSHRIDQRITPDRTDWAGWLACCQWTLEEIASGEPLADLFRTPGIAGLCGASGVHRASEV